MNILVTTIVPALVEASAEGVSAARGVLGLFAAVGVWALVFAIRAMCRVISFLLRVTLVVIAVAAFGATTIAVIAQVYLTIGPL